MNMATSLSVALLVNCRLPRQKNAGKWLSQVDIECERLRLKCEAKKLVSNGWLAIGSYNDRVHFATAGGGSRSQAEKLVQE